MYNLQAVPAFLEQRLRPTRKKSNCLSLPAVEKSEYPIFKVPFLSLTPAHPTLAFDLVFCVHELMLFFPIGFKHQVHPKIEFGLEYLQWVRFSAPEISDCRSVSGSIRDQEKQTQAHMEQPCKKVFLPL